MKPTVSVFWFRRDLRLADNAGLHFALKDANQVLPVFIFDKYILEDLQNPSDGRIQFIYDALKKLQEQLNAFGSSLEIHYGYPEEVFIQLADTYNINCVIANHDYEPYAIKRDKKIKELLIALAISFRTYKDQVIFEKKEIVKENDSPYSVFSPYARKWLSKVTDESSTAFPSENYSDNFFKQTPKPFPELSSMGFSAVSLPFSATELEPDLLNNYAKQRNFPAMQGTSRMGVHLRFGTVSIRRLVREALGKSKSFLNELIWREFYQMILWNFPHVGEGKAFKPEYDRISWRNNEEEFRRWTQGNTGYPLVDAGMRELSATGFMHNRVRMVVASFLTKHLLIDWRWGEAWFAQHLLDYEFASNNGGWQWASGSGCDAAPYFRIFNPYIQTKKFDPELKYISRWVPEFQELTYAAPIVDHDFARKRCIEVYGKALAKQ
jgi:deoxyribodipyrimidine photo-lyase